MAGKAQRRCRGTNSTALRLPARTASATDRAPKGTDASPSLHDCQPAA